MDHSHSKCATHQQSTSIDRRQFLKTASLTGCFLSAAVVSNNSFSGQLVFDSISPLPSSTNDRDKVSAIEPSIKANFGSGFRVESCQHRAGETHAIIEHLENRYLVASQDQHNWRIVESTNM